MCYTRLVQPLLQHIYRGMHDDSADVRNAAMFAVAQFSIHLQVYSYLSCTVCLSVCLSVCHTHSSTVV